MKKDFIKNIRDSYKHIPYTWKHYLAFLKVERQIFGEYKYKFHDWDKLEMYIIFPYLGPKKIGQIHQKYQSHHPKYKEFGDIKLKNPIKVTWDEAVIDWECARLTKPDKPMNARDTMKKYYPEYREYIEPVLDKYKL